MGWWGQGDVEPRRPKDTWSSGGKMPLSISQTHFQMEFPKPDQSIPPLRWIFIYFVRNNKV